MQNSISDLYDIVINNISRKLGRFLTDKEFIELEPYFQKLATYVVHMEPNRKMNVYFGEFFIGVLFTYDEHTNENVSFDMIRGNQDIIIYK